jgi:GMP reductase
MSAVVGETFANEAYIRGLSVCLHRFCTANEQGNLFTTITLGREPSERPNKVWCAIGLDEYDRFDRLFEYGCRNFIIDVANGYLGVIISFLRTLNSDYKGSECSFIVGNVHTSEGFNLYKSFDNVDIRVNISGGGACDTKFRTGVNRGQITELSDCLINRRGLNKIIADGGIRGSGDAAKAFGAGADFIMLGSYFSKAQEAENIVTDQYTMWGSASKHQMVLSGKKVSHNEGKVVKIDKSEVLPLSDLIEELWDGISSAISYSGYSSLSDFIGRGVFELKTR